MAQAGRVVANTRVGGQGRPLGVPSFSQSRDHFIKHNLFLLPIKNGKYTPTFEFKVGKHPVSVESVQTEVDAGYEGKDNVVLIEAKNTKVTNVIIRQFYYPFRQWQNCTKKSVIPVLFRKLNDEYSLWEFEFTDPEDYNSIKVKKSAKYRIIAK